jgi:hypothetical protein
MSDGEGAGESAEGQGGAGSAGRAGGSGGEPADGIDSTGVKPQAELGRAEAERIALQISARSLSTARRSVGSPTQFAIF